MAQHLNLSHYAMKSHRNSTMTAETTWKRLAKPLTLSYGQDTIIKHGRCYNPTTGNNQWIFIRGQEAMQHIGLEFQELYQKTPPQGEPLQGPTCFEITGDTPDEEEIAAALGYLHMGKSPGPSGIHSKDLWIWYAEHKDNPHHCLPSWAWYKQHLSLKNYPPCYTATY